MRLYREAEYTEANLSLFKCCEMLGKMEETIYVLRNEAHLLRLMRFASSAHPTIPNGCYANLAALGNAPFFSVLLRSHRMLNRIF